MQPGRLQYAPFKGLDLFRSGSFRSENHHQRVDQAWNVEEQGEDYIYHEGFSHAVLECDGERWEENGNDDEQDFVFRHFFVLGFDKSIAQTVPPRVSSITGGTDCQILAEREMCRGKNAQNALLTFRWRGQRRNRPIYKPAPPQDHDALIWIDSEGKTVTESLVRIFRQAKCTAETPALPRHPARLFARRPVQILPDAR